MAPALLLVLIHRSVSSKGILGNSAILAAFPIMGG